MDGMNCYSTKEQAVAVALKMCCNGTCCAGAHDMSPSPSDLCWAPGVTHSDCSSASILEKSNSDPDRKTFPPCPSDVPSIKTTSAPAAEPAEELVASSIDSCTMLYGMYPSQAKAGAAASLLGCSGTHMMGDKWMPGVSMAEGCGTCTGELAGHSMAMAFVASASAGEILFKTWTAHSRDMYWGSIIIVFLMALFYEWIKHIARPELSKRLRGVKGKSSSDPFDATKELARPPRLSVAHAADTIMYAVQLTLGYFLMLIAMVYNVGLFVSVILGACVGYALFAIPRFPGQPVDADGCCD